MLFPMVTALVFSTQTRRPNVLWVLIDDWGYNDVGFHNRDNENLIRTPHIDWLAESAHGVRLERFYSQPICTPTRVQALSGRYQIHTGFQHAVLRQGQDHGLATNESTIAERLRPLGYSSHAIGKWHIGMSELRWTPLRRGFDTFLGFWGGSEDHYTHRQGKYLDFRDGEVSHSMARLLYGSV